MATVASEIKREMGGSAEFAKMNRIQQEATAAAVGMSREELANTLVEQEALQRVGAKTGEEARAKYDLLRKTMTAEEAAASLGDKELAKQYEQQSVAEKFQQAVEKIKDIFVTIVDGPFGKILSGFSSLLSNAGILKGVLVGIGIILAGMAINAIMTASALTLGAAVIAVVAGAAVAFSAQDSATQRAQSQAGNVKSVNLNDGAIAPPGVDPNGGIVASLPKGGIIAQYSKDDYIVGTTNKPGAGRNDESFVESIIKKTLSSQPPINIAPAVYLDGRKISDSTQTNTNISSTKMQ
jgi:hypothetical protein